MVGSTAPIDPGSISRIIALPRPVAPRGIPAASLKRGALTIVMDRGEHPTNVKRLGRYKSFDVLGEYSEFSDLFARGSCSTACCDPCQPGIRTAEGQHFVLPPALPFGAPPSLTPAAVSLQFDTLVEVDAPTFDGLARGRARGGRRLCADGQGPEHPPRLPRHRARLV